MKRLTIGLLLSVVFGCCITSAKPQKKRPALDKLLAELKVRTGRASTDAKAALISRGESDPDARAYIAKRLPGLLESFGGGNDLLENMTWGEAAELAGVLKVTGAVPILCQRINLVTTPFVDAGVNFSFINRGAVHALIRIGPAAVPAVINVLNDGSPVQRKEAAYVLASIGTGTAWRAVEKRLRVETDLGVRGEIQELVKRKSWMHPAAP